MNDKESEVYENERTLTLIHIPTYQIYTVGPILYNVDTWEPILRQGNKALKRIVCAIDRRIIPTIDSY